MATATPTPTSTPTITTTTTTTPTVTTTPTTTTAPTITTTPTTTTAPTITTTPREDLPPLPRVHVLLPDFLKSIKLKYVKLGYRYISPRALLAAIVLPFLVAADADRLWRLGLELPSAHFVAFVCFLVISATAYFVSRPRPVYLVDFACGRPDDHLRCSNSEFLRLSAETGAFDSRSLDFQRRICERSGLGDLAYLPPMVFAKPPNPCMAEARAEAESVMLGAVDCLFAKTGVKPKDVGIVVVNCSLFNPTPSLSSMVVRRYKMRGNVRCFNLSGMGCSAGVIAVDLAKHLLRAPQGTTRGGTYALVVSSENITLNWYWGNDRSMLLSNCIFRMGAAAVLLSNRREDKPNAKYELVHSVRTHKGADDTSYGCVFQRHDSEGQGIGVALSKELMAVAGQALKVNITTLGPLVLPLREQAHFFVSLLLKKMGLTAKKPYIPDFKKAFEHFCIHAGGRGVLDEIEKNLDLSPWHMEPSRMTLYRFGNTSSSSLWYELAYTEGKRRVKKGDRVWQIAFGSGFKCNSAVWRALRTIQEDAEPPWQDCIGELPVVIPTSRNLATS